jgi:hypothetical protein
VVDFIGKRIVLDSLWLCFGILIFELTPSLWIFDPTYFALGNYSKFDRYVFSIMFT